jgi:hypothetical protein
MTYERMIDGNNKPTEHEILKTIGTQSIFWKSLCDYLKNHYTFTPEMNFWGKKHGWNIRYRKSGKTLCALFPETNNFSVLIVLGRKEVEKTENSISQLNSRVRKIFEKTDQLHDGRWLWIRILDETDLEAVKSLIGFKRKPDRQS